MDLKTLAPILVHLGLAAGEDIAKVVDLTAEDFRYSCDQHVLSPGLMGERWTKRQIIDLYNSRIGSDRRYSAYCLSDKRLPEIVAEISDLIRSL